MKQLLIITLLFFTSLVGYSQKITLTSDYAKVYNNKEVVSQSNTTTKFTLTPEVVSMVINGKERSFEVLDIHEADGNQLHFAVKFDGNKYTEELIYDEDDNVIYLADYTNSILIVFYNIKEVEVKDI